MEIISKEFQDKIKEDLKIDDLHKESLQNSAKQFSYFQMYVELKYKLIRLYRIRDEKYQELYDYFKYNYNKDLKSNEIDIYINAHDEYKKLKELVNKKELEVETIEGVIKLFQNRNWDIKNIIELEKLKK